MKLRHPLLIRIAALLASLLVRVWMSTMRVRIVSADGQRHPLDPVTQRYLYAFWHESLLAPIITKPKIRVLISQHRDGELIAQCCSWLGIGTFRGSSSRGGSQALLEMIRSEDDKHLGITPDGPKGPRRKLQPGVVMVASQSGLKIVPTGVGYVSAWRARSWDRFAIPKPFSTLCGVVGQPIEIPAVLDRGEMKRWQQHVEDQLLAMTALAEDWAERVKSDPLAPPPYLSTSQSIRRCA